MIRVVNIKHATPEQRAQGVYIGRKNRYYKLPQSPLANPHQITATCARDEAVARFREELPEQLAHNGPERREFERLVNLARQGDLTLLCWCDVDAGQACHGLVIKEFIEERLEVQP